MWETKAIIMTVLFIVHAAMAQENIQTRVPASLVECYANPDIFERDNRLPPNINMLIELIRKVEDTPGLNQDMRQLATSLVHRFRMDGIERAPGSFLQSVLPFSPRGFQFTKHRVLIRTLLPLTGSTINFPNSTLTTQERCALHFMLSNSIDGQVRNDEGTVCNQLSQYRSMRIPRGYEVPIRRRRSVGDKRNLIGDVEVMDELNEYHSRKAKKSGRLEEAVDDVAGEENVDEAAPAEGEGEDLAEDADDAQLEGGDERNLDVDAGVVDASGVALSQCPVENGVIRTLWGAVSAGPLMAGIAAGLEQQTVPVSTLLTRALGGQYVSDRQTSAMNVDNRWAATLAGDLAEVTLRQGPVTAQTQVGGIGGWNSTAIPRWYFLQQRERLEMTDAEIRGGLDGLILAMNVAEYRSRANSMRLSQLLDMYYSQRGVFSSNVRACERRVQFTSVAPIATLQAQAAAFSAVLDREMQLSVTLSSDAIVQFANAAATSLSTYIPQSLNDPLCAATSIVVNDQTIWRAAANLLIYLDVTWTFREVNPAVAQLLENLDVNPFGTTYTLMSANTGALLVNTSNSLSEFYTQWNNTNHQLHVNGLSLPNVLRDIRNRTRDIMEAEQATSAVGGRSLIALIIAHQGAVTEADGNYAMQEVIIIREQVPDLALLFWAGGIPGRFNRFVREESRDILPLTVTGAANENIGGTVNPVIQRIHRVPRRIINHRCGSNWISNDRGTNTMNQYVERGSVNFYRVSPNYFFGNFENQRIRIQGHGYSTITVCHSRVVAEPRANQTTANPNDITCTQVGQNSVEVDLSNGCRDHSMIFQCPPMHISVEATATVGEDISMRCTDLECRFPDNARFAITMENMGCHSGVERMLATIALLALSLFVVFNH